MGSRASIAVAAGAALVVAGVVAPTGALASAHAKPAAVHFATPGTHYSVDKPLCNTAPKPGHFTCFGLRRVTAKADTAGAHPYTVSASYPVGPSGGLTPADLSTAYGYNAAGGSGQTVGIVDAFDNPNIASDLAAFDTEYKLAPETATSFEKVGETGSPTVLPAADTTGWATEEALDVESVRSVCHGCRIVLVEANSTRDSDLEAGVATAIRLGADEVSNSYGGPEPPAGSSTAGRTAYERAYTYPGKVITAASGDDGWYSWDLINNTSQLTASPGSPNIPASLPTVVAVGGTKLSLNANGSRHSESVWNNNGAADYLGAGLAPLGATGGGCSVQFFADGWQSATAGYNKTGCGADRSSADVAADGDPDTGLDVYSTYNCGAACGTSGWQTIGGTSLSSPLIAAMYALAGGAQGADYPAMWLYGHAASSSPPLYDVKTGGNSWCDGTSASKCESLTGSEAGGEQNPNDLALDNGTFPLGLLDCGFVPSDQPVTTSANHQCNAAKGYDGPSGVGTPDGLKLFKSMSLKARFHLSGTAHAKQAATFVGKDHDPIPGGTVAHYSWKFGDHRKGKGAHPKHTYRKPGHYTVTLTETDVYGLKASTHGKVKVHKAKKHHHHK